MNIIQNSNMVDIDYQTILHAIEQTDSSPFVMKIKDQNEWEVIADCVNQGIDSYLEACNINGIDHYDNGNCKISPHSLCVLLRRLGERECSLHECYLQDLILTVLGFDDCGKYVGREAMGLE
jgi:hypothetical protein